MNGYLFDENLPINIEFSPSLPIIPVTSLGSSPTDTEIWEHAKQNDLVIVTKDADFSNRIIISKPPPRVIHLRFGNMRKRDFHALLKKTWPQVESLIEDHKLVNVYLDCFESVE
jgi:predicted nuclease of predicted toxin-antitoxin system